jgi:hypothetical protein
MAHAPPPNWGEGLLINSIRMTSALKDKINDTVKISVRFSVRDFVESSVWDIKGSVHRFVYNSVALSIGHPAWNYIANKINSYGFN